MAVSPSSKSRLTEKQLAEFSGPSLFDAIARAVCRAGTCRPRSCSKLGRWPAGYDESSGAAGWWIWPAVMDCWRTSCFCWTTPLRKRLPWMRICPAMPGLSTELRNTWPRLADRVRLKEDDMRSVSLSPEDLVVSVHACGELTDHILDRALAARCRVAVLPCCHDLARCDTGGLDGWLDGPLAIDVTRAARLRDCGYQVLTRLIPETITPKNRLLMGIPKSQ
ncbi:methyltransferase [Desulfosarcina cetonica]|uniref:methyltransferase n=1 Tax=Desulfosarcina cetonica TaxID=90730 RepID=UPI001FEF93F8|nr:methyltransferase [Desulfosarcina cetonica]